MRNRKLKPQPIIEPTCILCNYFRNSPKLYLSGVEGKKGKDRVCLPTDSTVSSSDTKVLSCEHFVCVKFFWCDRYSNQINTDICIKRKENDEEDCRKCVQFKEVKKAVEIDRVKNWKLNFARVLDEGERERIEAAKQMRETFLNFRRS